MQPQQVIAPLQGIATKAIQVQPRATGYQDLLRSALAVVQAFEIVTPAAVFVDFVEDPKPRGRQLAFENTLAVLGHVPVQIPGGAAQQRAGQGGFADLARAGDEDHFARQILPNLR